VEQLQAQPARRSRQSKERHQGFEALMAEITARLNALPRQLRSIAQLALDAPEDFALGTAAGLASSAGVHPSALVRFAGVFGFDGFAALRQVFRSHLVGRAPTYRERIESMRRKVPAATGADDVLRAQVDEAVIGLQHLSHALDAKTLRAAVDLLARSRHVYLLAARRSFPVVSYLAYALAQLERRVTLLDGVGGMNTQLSAALCRGDLLFVVSFRNYTPEVIDIARAARSRGADIIAMTDSRSSPLLPCASLALVIGDDLRSPFRSLVEPIVLAQSLVIALGHRLTETPARRIGGRDRARNGGRA
jgi:DNA-binding MurR/RpiR family transcriptional regulator